MMKKELKKKRKIKDEGAKESEKKKGVVKGRRKEGRKKERGVFLCKKK